MKRMLYVVVLLAFAAGCGTSSRSADSTLNGKRFSTFGPDGPAAAKRTFEQVVKADPNNKFGWYNLGVIAQSAHDLDTAATDYARAVRIDPHFESALYNLGILRYDAADYLTAVTYLRRAVTSNPMDANANWYLGLALRIPHTKATDLEATHFLNAALKINPDLARTLKPHSGSGGSGPSR